MDDEDTEYYRSVEDDLAETSRELEDRQQEAPSKGQSPRRR